MSTRFIHTIGIHVLLGVLAAPSIAQPASPGRDRYAVVWNIVPDRPVEPTTWVRPRTAITSARLVPSAAFVNSIDVRTSDGRLLLPAGTQLIGLNSPTMAACTMEPPATSGLEALLLDGTDRYVCLVDEDRDGRFEQSFGIRTPTAGLLTGAGRLPRSRRQIEPASYVETDPEAIADSPRVHVRYRGFASLVNELSFEICLSESGADAFCLGEGARVNRDRLPATFEAIGARFRIEAKQEDRLQIAMLSPIRAMPLIIMQN